MFIHSLIHFGYPGPSAPSSPLLIRGAPDYNTDRLLYRSFTPMRTGKGVFLCVYSFYSKIKRIYTQKHTDIETDRHRNRKT